MGYTNLAQCDSCTLRLLHTLTSTYLSPKLDVLRVFGVEGMSVILGYEVGDGVVLGTNDSVGGIVQT